nr:YdcF family protein [Vibrio cidicii]
MKKSRAREKMNANHVVIVLGKRLFANQLTEEGRSRVEALVAALSEGALDEQCLIAFCGGVTQGQTRSEASAMLEHFTLLCQQQGLTVAPQRILLEEQSTSTVENILKVSRVLIESGVCQRGSQLNVTFVSNDYHLQRIFEIQQSMDEQGLLRVLRERCAALGAEFAISYCLQDHLSVPYPHHGPQAELFLLIDELTPYRVYLEGVARGVFQRPLAEVRALPLQSATRALTRIGAIIAQRAEYAALNFDFARLQGWIGDTPPEANIESVKAIARVFNQQLISLNRQLDPEQTPIFCLN